MKYWQEMLISHHGNCITLIDSKTARLDDISWVPETGEYFDDVITRTEKGYIVNTYTKDNILTDTTEYESIIDYLGY